RQYERHLARTGEELLTPESSLVRIVFQSAVLLGLLDVGDVDDTEPDADSSATEPGSAHRVTDDGSDTLVASTQLESGAPLDAIAAAVRLSALGAKLLGVGGGADALQGGSGEEGTHTPPVGTLAYDGATLRVGPFADVDVSAVLDVMQWAPIGEIAQNLELNP